VTGGFPGVDGSTEQVKVIGISAFRELGSGDMLIFVGPLGASETKHYTDSLFSHREFWEILSSTSIIISFASFSNRLITFICFVKKRGTQIYLPKTLQASELYQ
jgi:hypothetical protein